MPPDHRAAVRHLKAADPVLRRAIERVGPCRLDPAHHPDVFDELVRSIVYQRVSMAAAGSIYKKFTGLVAGGRPPTSAQIAKLSDAKLRGAGLSPQKLSYMRDLCAKADSGDLRPDLVPAMGDEEAIEHMTQVKGVGRWTAEMVLIFTLGRPDVLPVDDYGFQRAVQRAYRMRALPSAERLTKLAGPWRPYRTLGTWYMWQSLKVDTPAP